MAASTEMDARLSVGVAAPVAVAVSGGSDSLALLRLAAAWCARAGRPLLALTVNHGLSPHAAAWTAFAGARAQALGAGWRALAWLGPKPERGLPAAARRARHALLAEAARAAGARVLLMGHTADDVAAGERMRAEGTAALGRLRAWAPSPAWPQGRGVFLLRPLLRLSRADLRNWLCAQGEADWVEDPANADLRYARARARAACEAMDAPPPSPAAEPSDAVAALAADAQAHACGRLAWPRERWLAAPSQARARVLAAAATCVGGGDRLPGARALAAAAWVVEAGAGVATLAGARIAASPEALVLTRAAPRWVGSAAALAGGVWDGRFDIALERPALTVARLAGHGARLPEPDRRALRAIPADARPSLPVLLDAAGVPHLPRPFGDGAGEARSLVAERLRGACGVVRREADLEPIATQPSPTGFAATSPSGGAVGAAD